MTTPNNKEEKCEACDALGSFGIIPKESHTCSKFVSPTPDSMEKLVAAAKETPYYKEAHPTPTDSWEKEFENIFVSIVKGEKFWKWQVPHPDDVKSFISQVRQKAVEDTIKKTCGVLRQIGTVENDEQMDRVIKVIKSLAIELKK